MLLRAGSRCGTCGCAIGRIQRRVGGAGECVWGGVWDQRLQRAAVYVQDSSPKVVAEALMNAAEEWAGTPEQADDMTVIVARLR